MSSDLGEQVEKIIQSLQDTWAETQGVWQDAKASKFGDQIDAITKEKQDLKKFLDQLQQVIESSEQSFPR